jgi:integrase
MGEVLKRGNIWWIRYSRKGVRHAESSGSTKKGVAIDLLRIREGKIASGARVSARLQRLRFDEAATDVLRDYQVNEQSSVDEVERRIRKHLAPFFGGRRLTEIGTAHIQAYIVERRAARVSTTNAYSYTRNGRVISIPARERAITKVSNGEINRELTILRRIFNLAIENEKLMHAPYVPLLKERNVRTGFFEFEQFEAVRAHLPPALQPVIEFAYITGWRIHSEVLPLQWRQVDFDGNEVRLDAHTTKNDEPRVFPLTDNLRTLFEDQHAEHLRLAKAGHIFPYVFFREVATGRGGSKSPRRIQAFTGAWKAATLAAGCPGRIPHDLRRTAIRNMVRRGVPERVAMQLTGHKTRSVFERYNIVSKGDLRTAAAQLSALTGTKKAQFDGSSRGKESK